MNITHMLEHSENRTVWAAQIFFLVSIFFLQPFFFHEFIRAQTLPLAKILTPPEFHFLNHVADLRTFIRSDAPTFHLPPAARHRLPNAVSGCNDTLLRDVLLVDAIYCKSRTLSDGKNKNGLAEALLSCALACMTHKTIPLTFGVKIPLTLESDSLHRTRVRQLPKRLFTDTPTHEPLGDADKLQHFFGSAYLTLILNSGTLADGIGTLIERGETGLVEGEDYDPRDVRANRLGQAFALLLEECPDALPSSVLMWWNLTESIPFLQ